MNITDQIIRGALDCRQSWMNNIAMETDGITGKALVKIYKKWEKNISKDIYKSEFSTILIFRDILLFDYYQFISNVFTHYFRPINTLAEIEFREGIEDDYNSELEKRPIVRKHYNFSRNHIFGSKITKHLANLFILQHIKGKLGFDVGMYPGKCYVIAFMFENVVYVWENGHERKKRLTIDKTGNEKILEVFLDIFKYQKENNDYLYTMIDGLPFIEGKEAQKEFDIVWYRFKKQTPLNYRCFPNTNTICFPYNPEVFICRHKGLYCIMPDKIEIRFARFLDLLNAIEPHEKKELLEQTIDSYERFLKSDYIENIDHRKIYLNVLEKLKNMKKSDSSLNTQGLLSNWKDLGIESSFLNASSAISDLIASSRKLPPEPDWDLIHAGIQEAKEADRKEQFELTKRAYIEAMREVNGEPIKELKEINIGEIIQEKSTKKLGVKQIALIHVYNGIQITRENATRYATEYGYIAKTSGEGLFQDYTSFLNAANRKGKTNPFTKKKMDNRIQLIKSILHHLNKKAKEKALQEIETLKEIMDNEWF